MPDGERLILDYTARDFDTIRAMLVGIAKGKIPEWQTVGEANDFGTLLIELYAYMGDVTNYYVDRVGSEAFLGTAVRRQSVLQIAEMLGYRPMRQTAGVVELTFRLDNESASSVEIPSGTLVATDGEENIFFETTYTVTVEPGEIKKVAAREGRTIQNLHLGNSKGAPNASYRIPDRGVIARSISVRTKESQSSEVAELSPVYVPWAEKDAVVVTSPTSSVFSTWVDDEGYSYIMFGDNSAGRIPPIGAEIEVSYRHGAGREANSVAPNSITAIYPGSGLPVDLLRVTNSGNVYGGTDPESIDSMRFSIPRAARVRDRAVNLADFVSLALQVPGVAKAMAFGQIYSSVNVRIAPVGGEVEQTTLEEIHREVTRYIEDRALVGSRVFVEENLWKDAFIGVDLHVLPGFSQASTETSVRSALQNLFAFDNLDFGKQITIGAVYRAAMRIEGVDWIDVTALNTEGLGVAKVGNLNPSRDEILRINPADESEDQEYGMLITSYGGVE